MRKHQRKAVSRLASTIQRRGDPLKWFDAKAMTRGWLTAYIQATPRERKLINRRMKRTMQRAMEGLGISLRSAAAGFAAMAQAFQSPGNRIEVVTPRAYGKTSLRNSLAKSDLMRGIYAPTVLQPKIPNTMKMAATVDELTHATPIEIHDLNVKLHTALGEDDAA